MTSQSNTPIKTVSCPTCGAPVPWTPESRYRPFCSERCKLIDLGQWADESYRVPTSPPDEIGE
ncbi:DNA gyrase inhibitor YacG [Aquitalea sp. S1-19]|nr:DNA gyrase inhibitor YacG [Aquitalea sp. S1-19]